MSTTPVDTPRDSKTAVVQHATTFPIHHYDSFVELARTLSPHCVVPTHDQLRRMCHDSAVFYIEEVIDAHVRVVAMARLIICYKLTKVEAEMHDVVVLQTHRSRGYARMVVEACIAYARNTDAQRIVLTSRDNKEGAQTLYRSCGFAPVARQSPMFELVF